MAGIDEPIKTTATVGGKKVEQIQPKYSLIHSHTARRTGASLMYLSEEFDTVEIMRITGDKSLTTLQKYIKASDLDNLQKLAQKHYFTGK